MSIAITVISGEEPNAIGIGPIIIKPTKEDSRAESKAPAIIKAKPMSIKMIPSLIVFIDFLF